MALKKMRLHWRLHPLKNDEWYNHEKRRMTEDELARELDINYNLSVMGAVFKSEFDPNIHTFHEPYKPDRHYRVIRAIDYGRVNVCLFAQLDKWGCLTVFKELILENSSVPDQARAIAAYSKELGDFDWDDIDDPAGQNPNQQSDQTDREIMNKYGIYPSSYEIEKLPDRRKAGIELLKLKFSERSNKQECIRIYQPGCPTLVEALLNGYRYKTDRNGNIVHKDAIHEEHPYEDVVDCLRYISIEKFNVERPNRGRKPIMPSSYDKYTGLPR